MAAHDLAEQRLPHLAYRAHDWKSLRQILGQLGPDIDVQCWGLASTAQEALDHVRAQPEAPLPRSSLPEPTPTQDRTAARLTSLASRVCSVASFCVIGYRT